MLRLRRRAFEHLRERPLVALRVAAAVAAVTERQVDEVFSDRRAFSLRTLVMSIDGRDDDIDARRPSDCRRVPEARRWLTRVDAPAEVCLELEVDTTGPADLPVDLSKAKSACQKRRRRLDVLVEEVRSDCLRHEPQARRLPSRCLGEMFREADR